jgi:hypothetical protein
MGRVTCLPGCANGWFKAGLWTVGRFNDFCSQQEIEQTCITVPTLSVLTLLPPAGDRPSTLQRSCTPSCRLRSRHLKVHTCLEGVVLDREIDLDKPSARGRSGGLHARGRGRWRPHTFSHPQGAWCIFCCDWAAHMARCGGYAIGHLAHSLKVINLLSRCSLKVHLCAGRSTFAAPQIR